MRLHQAFNLIELMIVVAIIAFLAVIAMPQYTRYQAKARQAEVMINLASLHCAQKLYHMEHDKYSTVLNGEGGIGWRPEGYKGGGAQEKFYYTYGFNASGAQEGVHYFTGKLGASVQDLGATQASEESFVAGAAGDVMRSGSVDVWHIDQDRTIVNVKNGLE